MSCHGEGTKQSHKAGLGHPSIALTCHRATKQLLKICEASLQLARIRHPKTGPGVLSSPNQPPLPPSQQIK